MDVGKVPRVASRKLITVLLVVLGAGAAVGPVLAPKLMGRTSVTATQALQILDGAAPGNLEVDAIPCDGTQSSSACTVSGPLPANTRVYKSVSDDMTKFTVAIDMFPTSSYLRVHVPLVNRSNNQIISHLKLQVPDGLTYYVSPYYYVVGEANTPAPATDPQGRLDRTKAIYDLIRVDANTWEIKTRPSHVDSVLNPHATGGAIGDIFDIHIDLALANGTPPGFFLIKGEIEPRDV